MGITNKLAKINNQSKEVLAFFTHQKSAPRERSMFTIKKKLKAAKNLLITKSFRWLGEG
jgi:hypothetical protein